MQTEFKENLPLDGEVRLVGSDAPFKYLGYLDGDTDKCAVRRMDGDYEATWCHRRAISVPEQVK